jgi:methyl-accepting chemotaxis protein
MPVRNTIGSRMIFGTVAIFLVIIAALMFTLDYYLRDLSDKQMAIITNIEQVKVQNLVHTMALSLSELCRKNRDVLSPEDLKKLVGEHTGKIWYTKTGYFFVYDMQGNTIALPPDPSLHGKSRWDLQDSQGKYLLREFVDILKKKGEGYVDYYYKNPQTNKEEMKFAYIEMIPGTEWLVGSGSYYSGVDSVLGESRSQFLTHLTRMRVFMLIGVLASILLAVILSSFLTRSISRALGKAVRQLSTYMARTRDMSTHASSVSQSMAEAAGQQASALEEIGSSLEEMASMTRQNAHSAAEAKGLMTATLKVTEDAAGSMNDLTVSMQEISSASAETQKIVKSIDEIAFQTNLLALNAAVEAARAGEAGAGFAVVADEVRSLAIRAAEAAKNTADMIEGTSKKVRTGSELAAKTNHAFMQTAEGSKKVASLIDEISAASSEQAQGIEQINKAITEVDKVTQQNAANAEESAAASEEMHVQAESMKECVQDLVSLVGGNGQTSSPAGPRSKRNIDTDSGAPQPVKKLPRPVQGNRAALSVSKGGAREVGPREVISLKDGDLQDF